MSLAGGGNSYCAVLTSGGVDCWGRGLIGELGDGKLSSTTSTSTHRSAFPQAVVGVGDSGTLSGVVSLVSDGTDSVVPPVIALSSPRAESTAGETAELVSSATASSTTSPTRAVPSRCRSWESAAAGP